MSLDFTEEDIWLSVVEPVGGGDEVLLRIPVRRR